MRPRERARVRERPASGPGRLGASRGTAQGPFPWGKARGCDGALGGSRCLRAPAECGALGQGGHPDGGWSQVGPRGGGTCWNNVAPVPLLWQRRLVSRDGWWEGTQGCKPGLGHRALLSASPCLVARVHTERVAIGLPKAAVGPDPGATSPHPSHLGGALSAGSSRSLSLAPAQSLERGEWVWFPDLRELPVACPLPACGGRTSQKGPGFL